MARQVQILHRSNWNKAGPKAEGLSILHPPISSIMNILLLCSSDAHQISLALASAKETFSCSIVIILPCVPVQCTQCTWEQHLEDGYHMVPLGTHSMTHLQQEKPLMGPYSSPFNWWPSLGAYHWGHHYPKFRSTAAGPAAAPLFQPFP